MDNWNLRRKSMKPTNKKTKKVAKNIKKGQVDTNSKKMTNKEKARLHDMNQIDWFPMDPYSD